MVKNQNTFWHFIVYLLLIYYFDFGVVWMAIGEVEKKSIKIRLSLENVKQATNFKAHSSLTFPHICGAVSEFKT